MDLVILAAGMGSRFGGLKQIEPINKYNEFIIDYSIFDAIKAGFNRVVFIIKEENLEIFRHTVGTRIAGQIDVEYVFQSNQVLPDGFSITNDRIKPLGTGHAIYCAKDVVKGSFAIINADDFYGKESFKLAAKFLKTNNNENAFGIIGYKVANTLSKVGSCKRGVCYANNLKLQNIIESSIVKNRNTITATPLNTSLAPFTIKDEDLVSMNMICFKQSLFNIIEDEFVSFLNNEYQKHNLNSEFLIPDVVQSSIDKKLISVDLIPTNSIWLGVTYKEEKEDVQNGIANLVKNGEYPEKLWN